MSKPHLLAIEQLRPRMIPLVEARNARASLQKGEVPASHYIPYACHYDERTLLTKSGELLTTIALEGVSFESTDYFEIDHLKNLRNALFKSIASNQVALWFHTIRKRKETYPAGSFSDGFAHDLNETWKTRARGSKHFVNSLYVTILLRGHGRSKIGGLQQLLKSLSQVRDHHARELFLKNQAQELKEIVQRFVSSLEDYHPRVLGTLKTPMGDFSEPLQFLSQLVNLEDRPFLLPEMDLSKYLPTKRLFFGPNALEVRGASSSKYSAMVSIKEYGPETSAELLDKFLNLPFEFIISQSFVFSNRQEALARMKTQKAILDKSEDLAISQIEQIDEALDQAVSGEIAFGEHHLTVAPVLASFKELGEAVSAIEAELINLGISAVREDLNMEPCFWAQLPGNFEYIARKSIISTANIAGFASFHNYPQGKSSGNHWGPAVTVLETDSGTPYFFNFHVADVGHTMIVGPTGSGKTVLMNFLCAQARKFNGRLFFFDKDRGAEIFLRATGGTYSVLGGGSVSGFNPLQLPDSGTNRAFLQEWFHALLTYSGETLKAEDFEKITSAINGNYTLAQKDRTLANIAPFFGLPTAGSLASRLSIWHSGGVKEHVFGGARDVLSLENPVCGFEMGELLNDKISLAPVLLYLFHRIQDVLDGTPTMIVLDEAWALLDNPIFAPKIKDWLKTFRKLNALVVFATQSVEDAYKSSISDTLVQQSATQIYFVNSKATEAYRTVFKLSARELEVIQESDPKKRLFLIKQGKEAVIAKLDLAKYPELLRILSGRAETVAKLDAIRARVGDDPEEWLPLFKEDAYETVSKN